KSGYRRVLQHHRGMMTYKNAKDFIRNMIFLPSKLVAEEPMFWKLQERLSHIPFSKSQHEQFMKPVHPIIIRAFKELGYANPEIEAQLLLLVIDMLWKKEACGDIENSLDLALLLEEKIQGILNITTGYLVIDMLWKKEACGDIENSLDLALLLEEKYNLI